jgi:Integrase core domain
MMISSHAALAAKAWQGRAGCAVRWPWLRACGPRRGHVDGDAVRGRRVVRAIAQHHGGPHTPTDQAWIELFFGHIKGEWLHLEDIADPVALEAELHRIRTEYNTHSPEDRDTTGDIVKVCRQLPGPKRDINRRFCLCLATFEAILDPQASDECTSIEDRGDRTAWRFGTKSQLPRRYETHPQPIDRATLCAHIACPAGIRKQFDDSLTTSACRPG